MMFTHGPEDLLVPHPFSFSIPDGVAAGVDVYPSISFT
jgi:hypothetical protein